MMNRLIWISSDILTKYLTGGAYYHLWFFVLIIQLYLLYPLISKIYIYFENKNNVALFLILVFIIGIIGRFFFGEDFLFPNSTQFISYLFYFVFGMFMKSNYESIKLKSFLRNYSFCLFILLLLGTILIIGDSANGSFSYNLSILILDMNKFGKYFTLLSQRYILLQFL